MLVLVTVGPPLPVRRTAMRFAARANGAYPDEKKARRRRTFSLVVLDPALREVRIRLERVLELVGGAPTVVEHALALVEVAGTTQ